MITVLLTAATLMVPAHDWYDPECCSDRDCRPALQGEIISEGRNWKVTPTGELFPPMSERRTKALAGADSANESPRHTYRSQDGAFHRCSANGQRTTMTFCIYVPDPGS